MTTIISYISKKEKKICIDLKNNRDLFNIKCNNNKVNKLYGKNNEIRERWNSSLQNYIMTTVMGI